MEKKEQLLSIASDVITGTEGLIKTTKEMISYGELMLKAAKNFKDFLANDETKEKAPKALGKPKSYSKEDVRAVLSEKSAAGFGKEVKALLIKHGTDKLSTLKADAYEDVIKEAKEIGNE